MDADVKRKQARAAQPVGLPDSLQPFQAALLGSWPPLSIHSNPSEVLDLTSSPLDNGLPGGLLGLDSASLPFSTPAPQLTLPPPRFTYPLPLDGPGPSLPSSHPLPSHEPLPLLHPRPPPDDLTSQGDINFKEILEDMLRSLNVVPPENPLGLERQSVIQFSPPFTNS